jgi:hypothetical protein
MVRVDAGLLVVAGESTDSICSGSIVARVSS